MSAFGGKADMTFWGISLSRSLLGVKRTCPFALRMSANDPQRTSCPDAKARICLGLSIVVNRPGGDMRRREFIALLCATATWPLAARAQQPAIPIVGYLTTNSREGGTERAAAFRGGRQQS